MMRIPSPRNGKVAGNLGQNAATLLKTHNSTCKPNDTPRPSDGASLQSVGMRVLRAKLDQLRLPYSGTDEECLVIAGQAYDLRSATAMVRQLGRASA
jgi:hypothetical protein